jgi:hypothetical protein|tara:strand:+ start:64 stop:186 length:123 start_codon:yes stop_codon:yes gene_type:complete
MLGKMFIHEDYEDYLLEDFNEELSEEIISKKKTKKVYVAS